MATAVVTESNFEQEVLRSELPVLVDLYADWCQPCKKLEPILESLAQDNAGKLKVVRVDVEASPGLARSFAVQSIPMLVLIAQGRPVDQVMGLVDRKRLDELIAPHLPKPAGEVEPKDLAQLLATGRAVAIDVRSAPEFSRYRIPGAQHVDPASLLDQAQTLAPVDGRLRVLYSRTTDDAQEAAAKLLGAGVEVAFLKGGFLHWEVDGHEVERG